MAVPDTAPAQRGRLQLALEQAPEAAKIMTQLLVDNPVPFGLTMAGTVVVTKILVNAVKPRTFLEALATMVAAYGLCAVGSAEAIKRGWLAFKVRDEHGCLVPLIDRQ